MKLRDKLKISFEDFFRHGRFDYLKFGQTKEWIIHNFPDPDGYEEDPKCLKWPIWQYGTMQLYFDGEQLNGIDIKYLDEIDAGDAIELDLWFLKNDTTPTLLKTLEKLNEARIGYSKKTERDPLTIFGKEVCGFTNTRVLLESGVELMFEFEQGESELIDDFMERTAIADENTIRLKGINYMKEMRKDWLDFSQILFR